VNRVQVVRGKTLVRLRDMLPSKAALGEAFPALLRGTLIGTLFGAMPGTGPTFTTFNAYKLEREVSCHLGALRARRDCRHGKSGGRIAFNNPGRRHPDDEPGHSFMCISAILSWRSCIWGSARFSGSARISGQ
jgi:hypothetical protein